MAEKTVQPVVHTERGVNDSIRFDNVPAGTVIKIMQDDVIKMTYTVSAGEKFSGCVEITGNETDV